MNTIILQIPMSRQLKVKAEEVAELQGFSSLQEIIRVFLNQLIANKIAVSFNPQVLLSEKNEERYQKMIQETETGKVKTKKFSNIDSLMDYLNK